MTMEIMDEKSTQTVWTIKNVQKYDEIQNHKLFLLI
jgi:hypothetical protein